MTSRRPHELPTAWSATLLPHPKRFSRSKAIGFCSDAPVGTAETNAGKTSACWWPGGQAELLVLEGFSELDALFARGDTIPGSWNRRKSGKGGAAAWRASETGLVGRDLHDPRFERTWAEGAGGGLVVGVGVHKGKLGRRPRNSGLVWDEAGTIREITAGEDVSLGATDGTRLAGSVGGRAALWPAIDAAPIDLATEAMPASELRALDDSLQIGYAFGHDSARAVIWNGTPESLRDLTPEGFAEARAFDGAHGFQVGFVRARQATPSGLAAFDDRAVIWNGSPDRWLDLNAVLPPPFNASTAWAIQFTRDSVLICGEAKEVEVSDPGTARESHGIARCQAVLWTAELR